MTWINLHSPKPKSRSQVYVPYAWPEGRIRALASVDNTTITTKDQDIFKIIGERRSRREFSALRPTDLSSLLWYSARTQAVSHSNYGFELEQRPVPSGGAIHPIHILIKSPDEPHWGRYDSRQHSLIALESASLILEGLEDHSESVLPGSTATKILLVAEPGKTGAKYDHPESVIWRDAGALLAVLSVVAQALHLNYCPLGITADPWASRLGPPGLLVGVGMAMVGRPT